MSEVPQALFYTVTHEWAQADANGIVTVGITEYAQQLLGDIVYVELPEIAEVSQGDEACVIESVKAAADVYAPLQGAIVTTNDALAENPGLINEDAFGLGWLFRLQVTDTKQLNNLLSADAYLKQIAES